MTHTPDSNSSEEQRRHWQDQFSAHNKLTALVVHHNQKDLAERAAKRPSSRPDRRRSR